MSMYTFYVRKENEEVLAGIENKSEFFNALLAKERLGYKLGHENIGRVQDKIIETAKAEFVPLPPNPETGYPCCVNKRKPCKHWHYDGVEGFWENEITHEKIEVA